MFTVPTMKRKGKGHLKELAIDGKNCLGRVHEGPERE
jgi:hypothetical protein